MQPDFDVIVIGGRPAGSTLAARLGKYGYQVLLLERAEFPSLPAASSPIIYAATMNMLDEIGADEAVYAHNTPRIHEMSFYSDAYQVDFPIPDDKGRDYAYAIDRARFDAALWQTAADYPTVTAMQSFNVTDLLKEGDAVVGVEGKDANGDTRSFRARVVVGADGRFSLVARKTKAAMIDDHDDNPTSLLYAYWENVAPYHDDGSAASVAYEGQPGLGYLVMDSADNTAAVVIEGQAQRVNPAAGQSEAFYLETLRQLPALWARLEGATMKTNVRGMRRVGNGYRQPGGRGWALVGDAYHQKDPLDGQGIYNAVFTSKSLAWAIRYWMQGDKSWDEALAWYDETARIKTYAMYKSVLNRVQVSLYPQNTSPDWVQDTVGRWMMEDPAIHQLFGRFITRQMPADMMRLMTPPMMARAVMRGGLRDLGARVRQRLPFNR